MQHAAVHAGPLVPPLREQCIETRAATCLTSSGPRKTGEMSKTHATGCSLLKGEEDPALLPDSEYPDWLWTLVEVRPSANELQKAYEGQGLTLEEVRMHAWPAAWRMTAVEGQGAHFSRTCIVHAIIVKVHTRGYTGTRMQW